MSCAATEISPAQQVGRYTICDQLAAGGMATVHLARLVGSAGFSRVVAAKRMHRHFVSDPDFKHMFLAEAQLAARIQHPNVVPILDVLTHEGELIIFMDYVHGESLHALIRKAQDSQKPIPIPVGCAIIVGALQGLHAAHEARSETGEPLGIVHRDVSPQNILVGADGVTRVLDFGIAKAMSAQNYTDPGTIKGKFSYMAPEVIHRGPITRQTDVFSAGVVMWELLTGTKLFGGPSDQERLKGIIGGDYPSPRQFNPRIPTSLEQVVKKALQPDPADRYKTALEFAIAIEVAAPFAAQHVTSDWVRAMAVATLDERMALIHKIESSTAPQPTRPSVPPIHSLTVPAKRDPTRQSMLTAVASPSAKRRDGEHRRRHHLVYWAALAVAGAAVLALWLTQRAPATNEAEAQRTDRPSTGLAPNAEFVAPVASVAIQVPIVATQSSARAAESAPASSAATQSSARAAEPAPAASATSAPKPAKHSASRAVSRSRTRGKTPSHAKPYLPNEL